MVFLADQQTFRNAFRLSRCKPRPYIRQRHGQLPVVQPNPSGIQTSNQSDNFETENYTPSGFFC